MQSHSEWITARKKLLHQVKSQVIQRIPVADGEIQAYQNSYNKEFQGRWEQSNSGDVLKRTLGANIVLGGDFHGFAQSQRAHLRILRSLPKKKQIALALECLESKHQDSLDLFMAGELREKDFLEAVRWSEHWGFSWSHYRPLLMWAKRRGARVFAINRYYKSRTERNLESRDRHMGRRIASIQKKWPEDLIYVIVGDLHLAKGHLVTEIKGYGNWDIVRIFLNEEKIYFRLAERGLENTVEVMRSGKSKFCWLSSPPWVKWQSYLIHLDQTFDADLIAKGFESDMDFTDHVCKTVHWISQQLGHPVKTNDLNVYSAVEYNSWSKLQKHVPQEKHKILQKFLANDKSFFLPEEGIGYLSRFSVNHTSDLAGAFIQAKLSGRKSPLWNMPKDFLARIWVEAWVFFLSLQVNHKRKSESVNDLKRHLETLQAKPLVREAMLLALQQKMRERLFCEGGQIPRRRMRPGNEWAYFEATRILGHMLGQSLYDKLHRKKGGRELAFRSLSKDVQSKDFEKEYYSFIYQLENSKPSQILEQRLV